MRFLASYRWRIFLIVWIVYSFHFATNVVREHYPAFSLVEHGTLFVDEYQGFHADIFRLPNGHSVIGNQVFVSVLAAVPLFVFDPVLDALERYSKRKLSEHGVTDSQYRTDKPNRVAFFRLVKERGLDLRFGAATFVTVVFFQAPLTALFLILFFEILKRRGVNARQAACLTFLFAFATPLFFRGTVFGHNIFVMFFMFIAFVFLWQKPKPLSLRNRLAAGFFGGLTLATDPVGVLILPLLYGYAVWSRLSTASWRDSLRESIAMIVGSIPPVLFLLFTQWLMYGNPFLPGQYWMPVQNAYVNVGARGFSWPAPDLFVKNLFDPGFGLYTWCPIMLLALVPGRWKQADPLILPRPERRFLAITFVAFLLFYSANQYTRLQWNSGLRYLLPVMPFLFLALSDFWPRLPKWARISVSIITILHSWVETVFREISVVTSWRLFLSEGIQLPWLRVMKMTFPQDSALVQTSLLPIGLLAVMFAAVGFIWLYGARVQALGSPDGS